MSGTTPASPGATLDIPLFPLHTVLYPDGLLPLQLFEARYLDMAADCLRNDRPFGVCLIEQGKEVGEAALPHLVGTLARIVECDMAQLGILHIVAQGGRRFRILDHEVGSSQLLRGKVELLPEPEAALPASYSTLLPLLERVVAELGPQALPTPHRFGDAAWVAYRLAENLPLEKRLRQQLLELPAPLARLELLASLLETPES